MTHLPIPEQTPEKKIVMVEKESQDIHYICAMKNPYDNAIIDGEYIELFINDYETDEYRDCLRPSQLLEEYEVTKEALVEIIKWQSKIIRELNELRKEQTND